jgi:hypothetical protein
VLLLFTFAITPFFELVAALFFVFGACHLYTCLVLAGNDPRLNCSPPSSLIELIKVDATLEEELEQYEDEFE